MNSICFEFFIKTKPIFFIGNAYLAFGCLQQPCYLPLPPRHTPSADLGCPDEKMAAYKLMKTGRIWATIEKKMSKHWRRLQQYMEGLR